MRQRTGKPTERAAEKTKTKNKNKNKRIW